MEEIKLIECPRDAWQGLADFIPTETKVAYLKELIVGGFRHIDAVSFVSPKHVKQMADSEEVMSGLLTSLPDGTTMPEIIGIVVNEKGLERALATPGVSTHWLSLFDLRVFSPRERQHEPRGIAPTGGDAEARNQSGATRDW